MPNGDILDVVEPGAEKRMFRLKNATLLRRLAEAVDGYRDRRRVTFVGPFRYDPEQGGHRLIGPFENDSKALDYLEEKQLDANEFGRFGPYQGTREVETTTSRKWTVTKVVVHVEDGAGNPDFIELSGKDNDAVFWSEAAVDKFLVPYYTAIGSLREGGAVQAAMAKSDTIALTHLPGSDWVDANDAPKPPPLRGSEDGVGLYKVKPAHGITGGFVAEPVV